MFSLPTLDVNCKEDEWVNPTPSRKLYGAASVGNSWGVISIGRGFNWPKQNDKMPGENPNSRQSIVDNMDPDIDHTYSSNQGSPETPIPTFTSSTPVPKAPSPMQLIRSPTRSHTMFVETASLSPSQSPAISPHSTAFLTRVNSFPSPSTRSPGAPRPRRRSSKQRVSLVAGQVSICPAQPPSPVLLPVPILHRADSSSSFLSSAASTAPPSPQSERESYLGRRSISEFVIEREIGKGAYGTVKRARENKADGSLGPPLVIKEVIKSRILADCWKRHPKYGTIPIEIYVLSSISSISFVLPPRRPWDPSRLLPSSTQSPEDESESKDGLSPGSDDTWVEGRVFKGHPNICKLLDFFEDLNFYYLVFPNSTPDQAPGTPRGPADLFELVENYPEGLPASSVRSYLGQIADALHFLHSRGIVHRDVKDENIILGPAGRCILIDFGSSGLVKKNGWDTFSGTLDYAGPEILRGERYYGKEQDAWAFGVMGYVLLCGECPFMTAAEAQEGLQSPFSNASIALDDRCMDRGWEGREPDGGGALRDAAVLVRACLQLEVTARPAFEKILRCRFLWGDGGWGDGP